MDSPDADGDWLSRARLHVGDAVPIIGTLDLHANVSPKMIAACQALVGYRTNPHLDQHACGIQAGQLMVRTLRGEIRPTQALVQLPMCVNIERQATEEPQGQELYAEANRLTHLDGRNLSLSYLYGFPYADVAEMGASVVAVADGDDSLARHTAQRLAQHWWQIRTEFVGHLISIDEAISMACQERERDTTRPVGLLDMGDNVGGGSAGDGTFLVHAWQRLGRGALLTVLYDPRAVKSAELLGVGARRDFRWAERPTIAMGAPSMTNSSCLDFPMGRSPSRKLVTVATVILTRAPRQFCGRTRD